MTLEECEQESDHLKRMHGIKVSRIGFICAGGFNFERNPDYVLIDGKELYQ